ncbi:MAG: hypothetical protein AB7K52_14230 [Phycisphaerales bacterium]
MSRPSEPRLITVGVIARELDEPLHRVVRVIGTRSFIRPRARAGTLRLFDERAKEQFRRELDAIDARRADAPGGHRG